MRVAAHRSREVFDPPNSVTLWWLPETIEEEFEAKWEHWLDQTDEWHPFFQRLENLQEKDLKIALHAFDAVTNRELEMSSHLRRSAEGRAVLIPATQDLVPDPVPFDHARGAAFEERLVGALNSESHQTTVT